MFMFIVKNLKFSRIFHLGFWYLRSKTLPGYDALSLEMNNKALAFHLLSTTLATFNNIARLFH